MKQVIAIGGGGFGKPGSTLEMERYILALSGKTRPKICFLPQASAEAKDYIVKFFDAFTRLGAEPTWLSLFGTVKEGWQEHLLQQDLIYAGGGNTKSMLCLWKEWKVDKILREAYERGIILSGR